MSSTSTPTSTPTRKGAGGDNNKGGFFKKIGFRRSSKSTSGSPSKKSKSSKKIASPRMKIKKKSKDQGSSGNSRMVSNDEPILLTRRVIKATRPPSPTNTLPAATAVTQSDSGTVDTSLSSSGEDRDRLQPLGMGLGRDGKDENLREKTEQFRLDRLENAAAIRKENKEKEVMQHRLGLVSVSKSEDDDGNAASAASLEEMKISEIFKTQTFHPENKRKVDTVDVEAEKKSKLDLDDDDTNAILEEDNSKDTPKAIVSKKKLHLGTISGWITAVAPATVVAAFAFVMMKAMRKR